MKENKRKFPLSRLEIIFLVILTPIIYLGCITLLLIPIGKAFYPHTSYVYGGVYIWVVFIILLGVDVVWIVLMKLWPLKNKKAKIILTWFLLTLSASVLTCFAIGDALDAAFS